MNSFSVSPADLPNVASTGWDIPLKIVIGVGRVDSMLQVRVIFIGLKLRENAKHY